MFFFQIMNLCFLCGENNCELQCDKCQEEIKACSKSCMKVHCPEKGKTCRAFVMRQNEDVGRYLVASRRIQPHEVVLVDNPIIEAPQSLPVCLVCLGKYVNMF